MSKSPQLLTDLFPLFLLVFAIKLFSKVAEAVYTLQMKRITNNKAVLLLSLIAWVLYSVITFSLIITFSLT